MKEFSIPPYTSNEQSERLMSLGLKKETADFSWPYNLVSVYKDEQREVVYNFTPTDWSKSPDVQPRWTLGRLIDIIPKTIHTEEHPFQLFFLTEEGCGYYDEDGIWIKEFIYHGLYEDIIYCIEWLIQNNLIDKELLEDNNGDIL